MRHRRNTTQGIRLDVVRRRYGLTKLDIVTRSWRSLDSTPGRGSDKSRLLKDLSWLWIIERRWVWMWAFVVKATYRWIACCCHRCDKKRRLESRKLHCWPEVILTHWQQLEYSSGYSVFLRAGSGKMTSLETLKTPSISLHREIMSTGRLSWSSARTPLERILEPFPVTGPSSNDHLILCSGNNRSSGFWFARRPRSKNM